MFIFFLFRQFYTFRSWTPLFNFRLRGWSCGGVRNRGKGRLVVDFYQTDEANTKKTMKSTVLFLIAETEHQEDVAEKENAQLRKSVYCRKCKTNLVSVVFLPCGHLCTCTDCGPSVKYCLICNQFIKGTVRTFLVWRPRDHSVSLDWRVLSFSQLLYFKPHTVINLSSITCSVKSFSLIILWYDKRCYFNFCCVCIIWFLSVLCSSICIL